MTRVQFPVGKLTFCKSRGTCNGSLLLRDVGLWKIAALEWICNPKFPVLGFDRAIGVMPKDKDKDEDKDEDKDTRLKTRLFDKNTFFFGIKIIFAKSFFV
jgi:hypothetical protein